MDPMETRKEVEEVRENKRVAILIIVLAAALAITETAGKSAQHASLDANIEASNLWAFYQAKSIRASNLKTAQEMAKLAVPRGADAEPQLKAWREKEEQYRSEPGKGEGMAELSVKARKAEEKRDLNLAVYRHLEISSGALQLAIVLASASVTTEIVALAILGGILGLLSLVVTGLGLLHPELLAAFL